MQRLYASYLAAGLSPTTVALLHNILHKALKRAIRWGLLTRNVTEAVDPPREATKLSRLEENIGAADVELTAEDLREIESAASQITVQGARGSGQERYV